MLNKPGGFVILGLTALIAFWPAATEADFRKDAIPGFVRGYIEQRLQPRWKRYARDISETVLYESERRSFDPILIVSLMEIESRFSPRAQGSHGEVGLMQIKPSTARWITGKYTPKALLFDPRVNVRVGMAYLDYLRGELSNNRLLYLTAYNRGLWGAKRSGRVSRYALSLYRKYLAIHHEARLRTSQMI